MVLACVETSLWSTDDQDDLRIRVHRGRGRTGIDLSGKRAIVTGAASGIGVETARALAAAGAEVTLAVRDLDAGERVAADITADTGNGDVHVAQLDLADQESVARVRRRLGRARCTCWSTTPA